MEIQDLIKKYKDKKEALLQQLEDVDEDNYALIEEIADQLIAINKKIKVLEQSGGGERCIIYD